jgi:flagellar biosynthesis anti-sigma factor FlgM
MKITSEESLRASQIGSVGPINNNTTSAAGGTNQSNEATPAATVSFSTAAQDISTAKAAIDNVPAGREQFVNSLKQQVEAGTYNVSSSNIADMMLRRASADKVS